MPQSAVIETAAQRQVNSIRQVAEALAAQLPKETAHALLAQQLQMNRVSLVFEVKRKLHKMVYVAATFTDTGQPWWTCQLFNLCVMVTE